VRLAVLPLLALAACGAGLAACGNGDGKDDRPQRRGGVARNVDPTPAESLDDVIDRTRGAVTAGGCEAVKGLMHSTYGELPSAACEAVKAALDGFQDPRGASYKTGAVVDYRTLMGSRRVMVLALDSDRTYRLDFVSGVRQQTVGTPKPAAFDVNAQAVVRAMQSGDCDAFLRLVSRTKGLGVGPDEEVCRRVSDVAFRRELVERPATRPVALGGNSQVAFYKVRTGPDAYYTMIMEREPGPGGSARYVLVNALPVQ
jgi:hypothetical protein